ncbi:hypothetical protein MMC16_001215 [Acarospora aff. strigata]|nr:hypothetical protein [Acarospora aff. strigata]
MVDFHFRRRRAYHAVIAMPLRSSSTDIPQQQHEPQQHRSQPYVPKLSYRHACPEDSSHAPRGYLSSTSTAAEPSIPPSRPSPTEETSPMRIPEMPPGSPSPSPRALTMARSIGSPGTPNKASKTKGTSFFGFLTVKEPSAQALLDYQEHVRKQAQTRKGRLTPVGMPGVSSAKLPPTVPKVNSRWDGVPHAVKEKSKETDAKNRHSAGSEGRSFVAGISGMGHRAGGHAYSSSSTLSSQASQRNGGTGSSIFSNNSASRSSLGTRSGWENASISSGSDTKDYAFRTNTQSLRSPSSTALPEITSLFPSDPGRNQLDHQTNEAGVITNLAQPPTLPSLHGSSSIRAVDLPSTEVLQLPTSTPSTHEGVTDKSVSLSPPAAVNVTVESSGLDVPGPPATVRMKSKSPLSLAGRPGLGEFSQDEAFRSILRHETVRPSSQRPARPPMSSYFSNPAPETGSSGRERPELGKSRKSESVTPWEVEGPANHETDTERVPTSPPQSGKGLFRRGRMALFNK